MEIPYFRAVRGDFSPTKLMCFEQVRGFDSLFFRGTPHNKFEEYRSISISGDIYNSFLSNTLSKYSSGRVGYSGKYFNIPSAVFTDTSNWSEGNFFYNTGEKHTYGLESTGTVGRSIFWKKIE